MLHASELINQWALRTKTTMLEGVLPCERFTDEPVYILRVTEHHIYVVKDKETIVLNFNYLDKNWCPVDPVYFGKNEAPPEKAMVSGGGVKSFFKN